MAADTDPGVVLEVNGSELRGWEGVTVVRSVETLAGAFSLSATELEPDDPLARPLKPGVACRVRLDGDLVVSGYLDKVVTAYGREKHSVSARGRDAAGDLVDCSADRDPGEWQAQTLDSIARDLVSDFEGVTFVPGADPGEAFPIFRINAGETVHSALRRGAQTRGLMPTSDGQGGVTFARIGEELAPARIDRTADDRGRILSARIDADDRERFSTYRVKGQTDQPETWPDGEGPAGGPAQAGSASDPGVTRYRPKVIVDASSGDRGAMLRRAQFEATTRAGKSRVVGYRLQGWRAGDWLWAPGFRVPVYDPLLGVGNESGAAQEMVVDSVTYSIDDNVGRVVDLRLLDPRAFTLRDLTEETRVEPSMLWPGATL